MNSSNTSTSADSVDDQLREHLTHVWNALINNMDQLHVRLALLQLVGTLLEHGLIDQSEAEAPEHPAEDDDPLAAAGGDPLNPLNNELRWADQLSEDSADPGWINVGSVGTMPPSSGQSSQINLPT